MRPSTCSLRPELVEGRWTARIAIGCALETGISATAFAVRRAHGALSLSMGAGRAPYKLETHLPPLPFSNIADEVENFRCARFQMGEPQC